MHHTLLLLFYRNVSLNNVIIHKDRLKRSYIAYKGCKSIVKGCGFSSHGDFPHGCAKYIFGLFNLFPLLRRKTEKGGWCIPNNLLVSDN